ERMPAPKRGAEEVHEGVSVEAIRVHEKRLARARSRSVPSALAAATPAPSDLANARTHVVEPGDGPEEPVVALRREGETARHIGSLHDAPSVAPNDGGPVRGQGEVDVSPRAQRGTRRHPAAREVSADVDPGEPQRVVLVAMGLNAEPVVREVTVPDS